MTTDEKRDFAAWCEREGVACEWYALRAMALRLSLRGYTPDEVGEHMRGWVDDAIKTLKRIEADETADTAPAPAAGK